MNVSVLRRCLRLRPFARQLATVTTAATPPPESAAPAAATRRNGRALPTMCVVTSRRRLGPEGNYTPRIRHQMAVDIQQLQFRRACFDNNRTLAYNLLKSMEAVADGLLPNMGVYMALLDMHRRQGQGMDALRLIWRMIDHGLVNPETQQISMAFESAVGCVPHTELAEHLDRLHTKGVVLPGAAYQHTITSAAQALDVELAFDVLECMLERGIRRTDKVYEAITGAILRKHIVASANAAWHTFLHSLRHLPRRVQRACVTRPIENGFGWQTPGHNEDQLPMRLLRMCYSVDRIEPTMQTFSNVVAALRLIQPSDAYIAASMHDVMQVYMRCRSEHWGTPVLSEVIQTCGTRDPTLTLWCADVVGLHTLRVRDAAVVIECMAILNTSPESVVNICKHLVASTGPSTPPETTPITGRIPPLATLSILCTVFQHEPFRPHALDVLHLMIDFVKARDTVRAKPLQRLLELVRDELNPRERSSIVTEYCEGLARTELPTDENFDLNDLEGENAGRSQRAFSVIIGD